MTKYVDSNGNLYDVLEIEKNFDIDETSANYLPYYIMRASIRFATSYQLSDYIIDNNIKPIEIYSFTSLKNVNVTFNIPSVETGRNSDTGEIRTDSLSYSIKYYNFYNFDTKFIGHSGGRKTTFNIGSQSSTPGHYDFFTIGLYRVFVKGINRQFFTNMIILAAYLNNEKVSAHELANIDGCTGEWLGINWTLDGIINEREQDTTDNTEPSGGYGSGEIPHDNISIPTLPAVNMSDCGNTLYYVTSANMILFRKWLWTTDWVENLKKIRTDPMQNIIGISLIDIPLSTTTTSTIYVGNVNSEVSAYVLSNSFIELDCGEITIDEYYGSFADYEPFIATTLYLPKVGFVQIPADVCVNNTIKVVYHIELSSGEGLCYVQLTSKRDGFTYIWNTYTCHITSNITLSAQDHSQQLVALGNAIINTGISASNAIINPASAAQGLTSTLSSCIDVATTKNPTSTKGNVGNMSAVMCYKKPYLLINRTNLTKPASFQENNGYLINYTAKIGNHTGFLQTRNYHCSFNAPFNHRAEIERLMNGGVIIND